MVLFIESDIHSGFRTRLLGLYVFSSGDDGLFAMFLGKLTKENDFRMHNICFK